MPSIDAASGNTPAPIQDNVTTQDTKTIAPEQTSPSDSNAGLWKELGQQALTSALSRSGPAQTEYPQSPAGSTPFGFGSPAQNGNPLTGVLSLLNPLQAVLDKTPLGMLSPEKWLQLLGNSTPAPASTGAPESSGAPAEPSAPAEQPPSSEAAVQAQSIQRCAERRARMHELVAQTQSLDVPAQQASLRLRD